LSLPQAYAWFCENPLRYEEDFLFMGGNAFAFLFPVSPRFLTRASPIAV
jgi:hypothetical protein